MNFFELRVSKDFISKSLEQAGFCDVKVTVLPWLMLGPDEPNLDVVSFNFITASKMNQASSCNMWLIHVACVADLSL